MSIGKFVSAVGVGAAGGALGTAGAIKYKENKDREREMRNTLMSLMPPDIPQHEKDFLVDSIMKRSQNDDIGIDKLAQFFTMLEGALGREVLQNIIKEAAESAANE